MYVTKLGFENFRNLEKGEFCPCSDINLVYGDNAQGKTNLIEAIWLFCGQRSFRAVKDTQLVRLDSNAPARLSLDFVSAQREQHADLIIDTKRRATLNASELKAPSLLSESFGCVIFSPSDMSLVNDGPAYRRRFLDISLCLLRPKYQSAYRMYNRAMQQRNAVLRDARYHSGLGDLIESFESRLAASGAYIMQQRQSYVSALLRYAPDIYNGISEQREQLSIRYIPSIEDTTQGGLAAALAATRGEDMRTGISSVGPHRDELELLINDIPVRPFGSQGQRRSAVVAIKLAEAQLLKNFTGEQPVAVLDDVMSELDSARQDYILNHINGWQVFITCCDKNTLGALRTGKSFEMKNGVLRSNQ